MAEHGRRTQRQLWAAIAALLLATGAGADTTRRLPPAPMPDSQPATAGHSDAGLTTFDPAKGLTPGDLVRRALRDNRELAVARLETERARGRLQQAALYPNPTLEVDHARGAGSQRENDFSLSFPAPFFGRRSTTIAAARASLALAEVDARERERQVASSVLTAHADLLASARALQLAEQLAGINTEIRKLVEARVREQDAPALDLRLLDVEIHRLEARQIVQRASAKAQLYTLRALLGMDDREALSLRSDFTLLQPSSGITSIDNAIDRAIERRPDLAVARAVEIVAEAELARVRAERRPELGLFARYSSKTAQQTALGLGEAERLFGGGISISLPTFNRNQGAITEAVVAVRQATLRREAVERSVRSEVASAFVRYDAARRAIAIYERDVNTRNQENLETLREAYAAGAIPLSEVLNEQRRVIDANADFTATLNEAYRAAADLQLATGDGFQMDDTR